MKNLFKNAVFALSIVLVLASCDKDQRVVNILSGGTWSISATDFYINDTLQVDTSTSTSTAVVTYDFEKCTLADDTFCDVYMTTVDGGTTTIDTTQMQVSNDGTIITIDTDNDLTTTEDQISGNILESKGSTFKYDYSVPFGSDTYKYEITLTKQ